MKKTYKKRKSNSQTIDKKISTNDTNNKSSMIIKVASIDKSKKEEESKNNIIISKEAITELELNLNKLKTDIDIERNNSMKDSNDLNAKLKELNNEINALQINNKYLTNNINTEKKKIKNNNKINNKSLELGNNIDKLNKKIKFKENMISNNKQNLKILKKQKNFLEKEIKENDNPEQKENLEKQLDDIFKEENEIKKDIEKLTIVKNEHEIVCKRKQKEYNKKIEIIKREIEYEQKKKDIFDKIVNDKKQNINTNNENKLNNKTDINILTEGNIINDTNAKELEKKDKKYINRNLFNKNNSGPKNIFNFYLRQFNENKIKKRRENLEIKQMLNSNINNINDIKSFSSFNNESNNDDDILNIKLLNNKNNSDKKNLYQNRSLFTKSEKAFLLKLIPDKCLDNYENKYDLIMKENISLQSKLNDKIRLKTLAKKNNLIKLENSELTNNVYHKKKLILNTKMNEINRKKFEINEKIKSSQRLLNYYDTIIASKNNQYYELLQKYRNIYNQIQKGKMFLKKGAQLTQENIICMDKYGKKAGDHTSINDINDDIDHGQVSEIYEENELDDNNENKTNQNNDGEDEEKEENEIDNESYNENKEE